jgi:MFS transporter, DHA2 family, multidrug resistance protein
VASAAEGRHPAKRSGTKKKNDVDAGWSNERSAAGDRNPWLIVIVISLATFMEVLDTAIANVALTHIAGSLSITPDEATWVLTSYLVANAVVVPISGWLSDVMGRKRFYMVSVAVFTLASLVCGLSVNLPMLILARIVQGLGGGGLATSEQSFLADTFPPSKRGMAFAAYGVVVIVAPILGPSLGGYITDNISWHWIFLINFPVGIISLVLVHLFVVEPEALKRDRRKLLRKGLRVDYIGFALVAVGLGCLEVFMDRGQRDDWFGSGFITAMAIIAGISLIMLVVWELNRKDPIVNIRLIGHRNFGICFLMMLMVGTILFGSTQIIPQMLQEVFGYTATEAGLALTVGGLAALVAMPLTGLVTGRVQTRILLGCAFFEQALALGHLSGLNADVSFGHIAVARMFQAAALPFLFVPINAQSYAGLKPKQYNQASALMNVARNLGGSIGISSAQALIQQREHFHQSRIVEGLNPLNPDYVQGLNQIGQMLGGGPTTSGADTSQLATLYQQVTKQAAMLSYVDVYHVLMIMVFCIVPLAIFLRPVSGGEGGH